MRLGAPVYGWKTAEEWAQKHVDKGFGAAYWPLGADAGDDQIEAFAAAARQRDLVIAEVGVWNNLLDLDPEKREANIQYAIDRLKLADRVGARCCVNIAGSYNEQWDGPHPRNMTDAALSEIVQSTRRIIDEASPVRADYTLENMPWAYPWDADSMQRIIDEVARERFAVHVDMVNMINSPEKFYQTGALTREFFERFGPAIRSIHAKDVTLSNRMTVHIDEIVAGEGGFDYQELLTQAAKLSDVPLMCEHLSSEAEYDIALAYIRKTAKEFGLSFTSAV